MEPAIQSFNSWQIGEFDTCLLPLDSETQENCHRVNPSTPMSNGDRIFPYNMNTISTR